VSDALVVQLEETYEGTWVRLDVQPAIRAFRPAADARLAVVLAICRELARAPIAPLAVQFPYRRPDEVEEYQRFFRGPLEFGAVSTALRLGKDDLLRPVVSADETLGGYLEQLAEQVLKTLGEERTIVDQVRRVLWQELSEGVPELDEVGRRLGLGARTLQRRLRARGTTFAGVLMQLRRDIAPSLLRDGQLAVTEVAFMLGYEDATSFHRSFRRWFGQSPRAFRRGERPAAG
jgi:AraC-like DNA-binding protein